MARDNICCSGGEGRAEGEKRGERLGTVMVRGKRKRRGMCIFGGRGITWVFWLVVFSSAWVYQGASRRERVKVRKFFLCRPWGKGQGTMFGPFTVWRKGVAEQ